MLWAKLWDIDGDKDVVSSWLSNSQIQTKSTSLQIALVQAIYDTDVNICKTTHS